MKRHVTDRAPLTQPWGQSLSNRLDAAPLRPHQGPVAKHMAEGEGGEDGACRARFSGGDEGESSDRRIHHAS